MLRTNIHMCNATITREIKPLQTDFTGIYYILLLSLDWRHEMTKPITSRYRKLQVLLNISSLQLEVT